jgi:Fur family iron response transcriptional regulator
MILESADYNESKAESELVACGVSPTRQRIALLALIKGQCAHLSAEDVYRRIGKEGRRISKATVYNTLNLLVEKGLVREVIADSTKVFYDPNVKPHHHFYKVTTGELIDIDESKIELGQLPAPPKGLEVDGVEVIIRVK